MTPRPSEAKSARFGQNLFSGAKRNPSEVQASHKLAIYHRNISIQKSPGMERAVDLGICHYARVTRVEVGPR